MGHLPIPADMYFEDFAMGVLEYNVLSNNTVAGTYQGLSNSDEGGAYIGFKMSDQPQISVGNTLCTADGLDRLFPSSLPVWRSQLLLSFPKRSPYHF